MKNAIRTLLTCLTLLSRIPVRFSFEPRYRGFLFTMPLVGFVAALPVLAIFLVSSLIPLPAFLAAGLSLFLSYAAFNLFHFDGLLDSADAFFLRAESEKRHRILKDSAIGSFALFAGVLYLFLKLSALTMLFGSTLPIRSGAALLLFYPVAGRTAASLLPLTLKPARNEGLGRLMGQAQRFEGLAGLVLYAAAALVLWHYSVPGYLSAGGMLFLASVIAAWIWTGFLYRKIGGFTGDAFGLAVELGELFYLLGLALILAAQ